MRIYQFNNFTTDTRYAGYTGTILLAYLVKIIETSVFLWNRKFGEYFCEMPPRKRSKRRSNQEGDKMSTQAPARSPEVDELSRVPETQKSQQAAGVEELVVRVEDPLQMSDTEQVDIALETQQDLDSSDENTQDTPAAGGGGGGGTQKGKSKGKGKSKSSREGQHVLKEKADQRSKKPAFLFSPEQKLVDFLQDNEILYNKHLMDYKDRLKREAVWNKKCEETTWTKMPAKDGFRASAQTLER